MPKEFPEWHPAHNNPDYYKASPLTKYKDNPYSYPPRPKYDKPVPNQNLIKAKFVCSLCGSEWTYSVGDIPDNIHKRSCRGCNAHAGYIKYKGLFTT